MDDMGTLARIMLDDLRQRVEALEARIPPEIDPLEARHNDVVAPRTKKILQGDEGE